MKVTRWENELPIKSWCETVEGDAMAQAHNLAALPYAFHHIALMPDCHTGYGMPIGGVLATVGVVIPNAVGVDIGCGMCAVKTSLPVEEYAARTEDWRTIMAHIRERIPVGPNHNKKPASLSDMQPLASLLPEPIVMDQFNAAQHQLGTLGGGNHFIEIQKGSDGHIWIMLHSGSRNVGYQVARHYNEIAKTLNNRWQSVVPHEAQLAFLPLDSDEGKSYFAEMQWCVTFALCNRLLMMSIIIEAMAQTFPGVTFADPINIAHNYAAMENHFGKNVMVHRKGATRARGGDIGIIPGSQGTCSYVVEGLGEPESFMSCSHGAGRAMSRTAAKERLILEAEIAAMDEQGIIHNMRTKNDLDEASGAYKPIEDVMQQQADLVKPLVKLWPLAVIKG